MDWRKTGIFVLKFTTNNLIWIVLLTTDVREKSKNQTLLLLFAIW